MKKQPDPELSEHLQQVELFRWAGRLKPVHPELDLMFAVPNGGDRNFYVALKLKAEGVKAGVSDIMLPVARHGYHGLFLELKRKTGRLRATQRSFLEAVNSEGYLGAVAYGVEAAKECIMRYLEE